MNSWIFDTFWTLKNIFTILEDRNTKMLSLFKKLKIKAMFQVIKKPKILVLVQNKLTTHKSNRVKIV